MKIYIKYFIGFIICFTVAFASIFLNNPSKTETDKRNNPFDKDADNYIKHEIKDEDNDGEPDFTITWNNGNNTVTQSAIDINIIGYAQQYIISVLPDFSDAQWQTFKDKISFTLPAPNGTKTVYLKFIYHNGVQGSKVYSKELNLNVDPSIQLQSFSINNNAQTTSSTNVTLNINCINAQQMMIANDDTFSNSSWIDYAAVKTWVLIADATTNHKTVYIKFKNTIYSVESSVYSYTISPIYDEPVFDRFSYYSNLYITMNNMSKYTIGISTNTNLSIASWVDVANVVHYEWGNTPFGKTNIYYQLSNKEFQYTSQIFTNSIIYYMLKMQKIDGDTYTMGRSDLSDASNHAVTISPMYVSATEITWKIWTNVMYWATNNGFLFNNNGQGAGGSHPVTQINWYDCIKWCNALSEMLSLEYLYYSNSTKTVKYNSGQTIISNACVKWESNGFRLLTEAEWEYACKAGSITIYFWGDSLDGSKCNYNNSGDDYDNGTTPVMYYDGNQIPSGIDMSNNFGLYDISGNVFEWCWDWYDDPYDTIKNYDPKGPEFPLGSVTNRILRGGSYFNTEIQGYLESAYRFSWNPVNIQSIFGFRVMVKD